MSTRRLKHCSQWLGLAGVLAALSVNATQPVERVVWGKVTHVSPVYETVTQPLPATCPTPKPSAPDSIAALLAWDLDLGCRPGSRQIVSGYEVHYTWDGRTYQTAMSVHPGTRVPLKITIR